MRRRAGFTLVEMMVSVALVLFIMVILTEAFGKGLESFRTLKAIGDMESRLRAAAAILRRDLEADHFEGKRRLSDPAGRWTAMGPPREGFFRHYMRANNAPWNDVPEGADSDGLTFGRSRRSTLHFSVKLRGNDRGKFFTAKIPPNSPLFSTRTNFFGQPPDARFQDSGPVYSSQWAEVAYFLVPSGQTPGDGLTPPTPLYTLFRSQFVVVADNSELNWPTPRVQTTNPADYEEISCKPLTGNVYINNPSDLNDPAKRAFDPANPTTRAANPLLSDVISFRVEGLVAGDTHPNPTSGLPGTASLTITLRIWEPKTRQARQIQIIQDM